MISPMSKTTYDYYIEPCQLCISRGTNINSYGGCGWCAKNEDTYHASDNRYIGDIIKIPYEGYGYPFHEIPHETRKYYKNNKYINNSKGTVPSDVTQWDIRHAHARNRDAKSLLKYLCTIDLKEIKQDEIHERSLESFLQKTNNLNNEIIYSPEKFNIKGKIEFRYLTYTLNGLDEHDFSNMEESKYLLDNKLTDVFTSKLDKNLQFKLLMEVVFHESFHIYQAVNYKPLSLSFEAERRLSTLKWMLSEDYFIDRRHNISIGDSFYSLLYHLNKESELYNTILLQFSYCIKDVDFLLEYNNKYKKNNLSLIDLIEGQAYIFQLGFVRDNLDHDIIVKNENIKDVYINAWLFYKEHGGYDWEEFIFFVEMSFKNGVVIDSNHLSGSSGHNPSVLFYYLCINQRNIIYKSVSSVNNKDLMLFIEKQKIVLNNELVLYFSNIDQLQIASFFSRVMYIDSIQDSIFDFYNNIGTSEGDLNNMNGLLSSLDDVRHGQADERISSVTNNLKEINPILVSKYSLAFILSFKDIFYKDFFDINNIANMSEYTGGFGDDLISLDVENNILDIIESFESLSQHKRAYCCTKHGIASLRKILSCHENNNLSDNVKKEFNRSLSDMITFKKTSVL